MSVEVIDKIKPKNGGNFKIVDSVDVEMPDGSSLQEVIKYLTDNVEDITQGKFDPSKYYNMEEIIAKYYDKNEIDDLLLVIEDKLDAEQIEENITDKVNSLFPLGIDLIDYDFNIYLEKEDLLNEVKKILDDYDLDVNSNIDMEKLQEIFYDKSETMNREEIAALFNSLDKEKISKWINEGFYNKEEVENLLKGKLNIEVKEGLDKLSFDFEKHVTDSKERIDNLEIDLERQISEGLESKANATTVEALSNNFDTFANVTFYEAIETLCNADEVKKVINNELKDGNLKANIEAAVVDSTFTIQNKVNNIRNDLERYAYISYVNEEIKNVKAVISAALKADEFNADFVNVIDDINKKIKEIEDLLDENKFDEKLSNVFSSITNLQDDSRLFYERLSEYNDSIKALQQDTTDINKNLEMISEISELHDNSINNIESELKATLKSFEEVKEEYQKVKDEIIDKGLDEYEHQVGQLQEEINILNAEPYLDDMGVEAYPEGSVYDKIFNSANMRYDIEMPEGIVSMLFNASDFNSDLKNIRTNINTLDRRISDAYTTIDSNSFRIVTTEGEVFSLKDKINTLTNEVNRVEEFNQQINEFSNTINTVEEKVNNLEEVSSKSIITKINNTDETAIINSNALNLRGSIDYYCLSGDLASLLNKTSSGVFLNGSMITPNTIDAKSLNLKGITVKSIIKDNNTTINKYETFGISDSGNISIVNPSIISTNFNGSDISGYQLLPDGKAIFNDAEIRGKFILPNAGLYGITNNDVNELSSVRIWAGSTEEKRDEAPFRVQQDGFLFASDASIGGTVVATTLHSGSIHMENDELKINNKLTLLNNAVNSIDEYLNGDEEEFICLNSRETILNTNVKFSDSFKYNINFKTLDLDGKLNIKNEDTEILFNEKGIKLENPSSRHEIYQNKQSGTMIFESGNNSSTTSPDFMFTSRNSVRDCNVKIKGSLEVTEEIKSNKNNVVLRSTENGFAFFSI